MVTTKPRSIGGIEIKSADSLPPWGVCLALYGPPGVGKTTAAAKVAQTKYNPVLICDAEGGIRSVTHIPNVDIVEISTWPQLLAVSKELTQSSRITNCCSKPSMYRIGLPYI